LWGVVKIARTPLLKALALVAICVVIAAQQSRADTYGSVRGRLTDVQTGQGIGGERVTLAGAGTGAWHATTSAQGYFGIVGVPAGHYVLTVLPAEPYHVWCAIGLVDVGQGETTIFNPTLTKRLVISDCLIVAKPHSTANVYNVENP